MGSLTALRTKADVDADQPLKGVNDALAQLTADATEKGLSIVGPVKLKGSTTKQGQRVTVTAQGRDALDTTEEARPVRVRENLDGRSQLVAANAALQALRAKALEEHRRLVGPFKVKFTETKTGAQYVTASSTAVPLEGLLAQAKVFVDRVADGDVDPAKLKAEAKPLAAAVKAEIDAL